MIAGKPIREVLALAMLWGPIIGMGAIVILLFALGLCQ